MVLIGSAILNFASFWEILVKAKKVLWHWSLWRSGRRCRFLVLCRLGVQLDGLGRRVDDVFSTRNVASQRHVEQRRVLLDDGELNLSRPVALREDLHGVNSGQQDPPKLALLGRLEADVTTFNLFLKKAFHFNC